MWSVELVGRKSDLADFTRWFPEEPAKVVANGDKFFLEGKLFEGLHSHEGVRRVAEERLNLMCAAIKLVCEGLSLRPSAGAIYRIDDSGARHAFAPGLNLMVRIGLEVRSFQNDSQRPTATQKRVEAAMRNESLRTAMVLWADGNRTWPRLYRILEEIEYGLGGRKVHEAGLASKAQRERFKQSAGSPEVAGADSRHGPKGCDPPKRPMSIKEAEAFIASLLDGALLKGENSRDIS
jgi:hypothetical protein